MTLADDLGIPFIATVSVAILGMLVVCFLLTRSVERYTFDESVHDISIVDGFKVDTRSPSLTSSSSDYPNNLENV